MDGTAWRPARWTPAQLEERRLAAATLLRQGRLTQAAIDGGSGSAAMRASVAEAYGFTVQRSATRAKERDERTIAAWPRREWVAIKKEGPP